MEDTFRGGEREDAAAVGSGSATKVPGCGRALRTTVSSSSSSPMA